MLIKLQFILVLIIKQSIKENYASLGGSDLMWDQWVCDSGERINRDELCDGFVNCKDGSDETVRHCIDFKCPGYAFRCAYGACISGNYKCDKKNDCVDGSDEIDLLCKESINNLSESIRGQCDDARLSLQCKSGECIGTEFICDGHRDCSDGSDETKELCSFYECPDFAFRCGYGACVSGSAKCDGVMDCADNSDEENDKCRKQTNDNAFSTSLSTTTTTSRPFNALTTTTTTTVTSPSLSPDRDDYDNGRRCRVLQPDISIVVSCSYQNQNTSCDQTLPAESQAFISCAPGYKYRRRRNYVPFITCNGNGKWSHPLFQCVPICGELDEKDKDKVVRPWDVTIFRKTMNEYSPVCSGVIVSHRIVLTVAHCLNRDERTIDMRTNQYNVVEGFYKFTYKEDEVIPTERHDLEKISIYYESDANDYRGLVILVLKDHISFSEAIKPICLVPGGLRKHNRLHRVESKENLNLGLSVSIEDSRHYLDSLVANLYDGTNGPQVEYLYVKHYKIFIKRHMKRYSDIS
uniref:Serine protease protein n=1 Tax=Glossina morsitans morsitans TaxID=37546 RepID=Q2I622_GLOMM|nr:serine protease protein [Glossina morsitans morsitans]